MRRNDAGRGLTDRKICLAVTIGVCLGIVAALLKISSLSESSKQVSLQKLDGGGDGESLAVVNQMQVKMRTVEKERDKLRRLYEDSFRTLERLREDHGTLKSKVDLVTKERDSITRQLQQAGVQVKVGPPGTVHSERTNPPVLADRSINPGLADLLDKIAVNNEVLVAVSNNNIRDMLHTWFENVKKAGVTNYIVVALDDEVAAYCRANDVPVYRRDATIPDTQAGTGDNHAISGLKFILLREFLQLGYSVFLSDVDIVFLQNPFKHLVRDCDVEGMTDGFDDPTAYGYNDVMDDPAMGWARYVHTMRIFVFNSGLFYMRPTVPAIDLLDRVTHRLAVEKAWDQAVFNEELFFPSHPGYEGLHASRRVLDYKKFLNSKFLFKIARHQPHIMNELKPVSVHVNYHPDKHERMLAIVEKWVHGKKNALDRFPDGSQ